MGRKTKKTSVSLLYYEKNLIIKMEEHSPQLMGMEHTANAKEGSKEEMEVKKIPILQLLTVTITPKSINQKKFPIQ